MQFKVPQFLDIEDKIFGPFTFRQFVYLAGGAGLCFVLYKLLGFTIGIIPMLAVAGLSLALTFYRPNNKPFINMLEAGAKYLMQNKLYVWKKRIEMIKNDKSEEENNDRRKVMYKSGVKLDGSKLRDLAWSLDVLDLSKQPQNRL